MGKTQNRNCRTCGQLFKCSNATPKSKPCGLWKACTLGGKIDRCNKVFKFLPRGGVFSFTP
jgi:hypothetical protein